MNELNLNKMQEQILINSELAEYKTNHILHLILTIITAGIWSIIWLLSAASGMTEQNKIRRKHNAKTKINVAGITVSIWVVFVAVALALAD